MEYVDGQRIDEYCDGRRLDIPARLRLFAPGLRAPSTSPTSTR